MPSGETWIDVVPRGVNKATGPDPIRRYYGISRDELRVWRFYERLRYAALCGYCVRYGQRSLRAQTVPQGALLPRRAGRSGKMRRILEEKWRRGLGRLPNCSA